MLISNDVEQELKAELIKTLQIPKSKVVPERN